MTNDNTNQDYLKDNSVIENFIERNKSVLLPYEEDEIRQKSHPMDIKCFGELGKEKRENFERNKYYKKIQFGEQMLFTDPSNKRYKAFPNDHIDFRYKIDCANDMKLGKGVFGEVIKCFSRESYTNCALKIIKNEYKYIKPAQTEIKLLKRLSDDHNEYVIKLIESFKYRGHIFLVFNCYYKNMYELIKLGRFKGFPIDRCIDYGLQLANGLNYIHSKKIIHCDLKPENIMFKSSSLNNIIIIDFGLSSDEDELNVYLNKCRAHSSNISNQFYVQSRYYRAAETVLCISRNRHIDIWSFGAILYEMLFGSPLFTAVNNAQLLRRIVEVIGYPPLEYVDKYDIISNFVYYSKSYVNTNTFLESRKNTKKTKYINTNVTSNYFNVIRTCIDWDFEKRIKSDELFRFMKIIEDDTSNVYNFNMDTRNIEKIQFD